MNITNKQFFTWLADRLVYVYDESPNVDFVLSLHERIISIDKMEQELIVAREKIELCKIILAHD